MKCPMLLPICSSALRLTYTGWRQIHFASAEERVVMAQVDSRGQHRGKEFVDILVTVLQYRVEDDVPSLFYSFQL